MANEEDKKEVGVSYKKKRRLIQWVKFAEEEPEMDGVVVLYIPNAYSEKYFMMNLSAPCHKDWYEKHKRKAEAWFRIPKYRKQDAVVDYDRSDIIAEEQEILDQDEVA